MFPPLPDITPPLQSGLILHFYPPPLPKMQNWPEAPATVQGSPDCSSGPSWLTVPSRQASLPVLLRPQSVYSAATLTFIPCF